jgi:hypothetical protein
MVESTTPPDPSLREGDLTSDIGAEGGHSARVSRRGRSRGALSRGGVSPGRGLGRGLGCGLGLSRWVGLGCPGRKSGPVRKIGMGKEGRG